MYILHFSTEKEYFCNLYSLPAQFCDNWQVFVSGVNLPEEGISLALAYPSGERVEIGYTEAACSCTLDDSLAEVVFGLWALQGLTCAGAELSFGWAEAEGCIDITEFGWMASSIDGFATLAEYQTAFVAYLNSLLVGTAYVRGDGAVVWTVNRAAFATAYSREICATEFRFCGSVGLKYDFEVFSPRCCPITHCEPDCNLQKAYLHFPAGLLPGAAQLIAYMDDTILAYSRWIEVGIHTYSALVRVRNYQSAFGYPYSMVPGWYQQIRLGLWCSEPNVRKKQLISYASTGLARKIYARLRPIYTLTTDYFDAELHLAFAAFLEHDVFMLYAETQNRFIQYVHEDNYTIDWQRPPYPFARAKTKLLAAQTEYTNSFC